MRSLFASYQIGKDDVMRNLSPHDSSFFFGPIYNTEPYNDWIQLVETNRELNYLQELFRIVPKGWIKWVNKQVERKILQGVEIRHPLDYRLSVLTHGLISLQETKYICDILENALRQVIISHIMRNHISYDHINGYMPMFRETFERYSQSCSGIEKSCIISSEFIMSLSFYQLIEIISRKWKVLSHKPFIRGFGQYFEESRNCRDYNAFKSDMTTIRKHRNVIAHTQNLLSNTQTQEVFNLSLKWLTPLGIDLADKVSLYRKHRPEFLKEIMILKK